MSRVEPLAATEAKAAQLLDMKPSEFRALVEAGHLPPGKKIAPGMERWSVEDLRKIASGDAVEGGIPW